MNQSAIAIWLKGHPVFSFVLFTYSMTALVWLFIVAAYGRIPIEELFGLPRAILLVYLGAGAPTIVAIVITALTKGRTGLLELGRGVIRVRIGILPWVLALGIPFGTAFSAAFVYHSFSNGLGASDWPSWYNIVPLSAAVLFLAGPLCEELGWRGYLQPHLLRRFTPLRTAIIVGIIWCFWHIPLSFTPGTTPILNTTLSWAEYLVSTIIASALVLVIVVKGNGSIAAAMVFHWASNAALSSVVMPIYPFATVDAWARVEQIQLVFSFLAALLLIGSLAVTSNKAQL